MKKYIFIIACLPLLFSCNDFLDTENLTKKDTSSFPGTEADAEEMVTGIYSVMNNAVQNPDSYPFYVFEMAGDDRAGGGGTSNVNAQCADRIMNVKISFFEPIQKAAYAGIFRANNAIQRHSTMLKHGIRTECTKNYWSRYISYVPITIMIWQRYSVKCHSALRQERKHLKASWMKSLHRLHPTC